MIIIILIILKNDNNNNYLHHMVIFKQPLYWLGLYAIAFIICLSLIFASYTYYINQLSVKNNEILQENYQVILNHSLIKFKEILNKLPSDSSGKSTALLHESAL